jgi:surface polysaccharide O-acyltransferase-like enzyme
MKMRNSKYELMRILAMMFIILSHFSLYGDWSKKYLFKGMQFQPLGQIGVYFFVMISGYFLSSKNLDLLEALNRSKKIWVKTIFYSWGILLLDLLLKFSNLNPKSIISSIFPVLSEEYWFITCFIVLMLLTPVLNWIINSSSKEQLLAYTFVFMIVVDILPIFKTGNEPLGGILSTSIMVAPYLIAGYIKKYGISIKTIYLISIFTIVIALDYYIMFVFRFNRIGRFTYGILPLILAVCLFLIIKNSRDFVSLTINRLSTSVLAAYLISENPNLRDFIWQHLFNIKRFESTPYFTIIGVVIVLIILISCCLIDKICAFFIKKLSSMAHK